jgi:hypothetical protein
VNMIQGVAETAAALRGVKSMDSSREIRHAAGKIAVQG